MTDQKTLNLFPEEEEKKDEQATEPEAVEEKEEMSSIQEEGQVATAEEESKEEVSREQEEEAEEREEEETEIPDIEPVSTLKVQGLPDIDALKKEAEAELKYTNELYKQATGQEYDPDLATPEEKALYEKLREQVKEHLKAQKEQTERLKKLELFEEQVEKTEPRYEELLSFVSEKARKLDLLSDAFAKGDIETATKILQEEGQVLSKVFKLREAYLNGDVDAVAKHFNEIRKEFYTRSKGTKKTKRIPEPPAVEKPGVEPVQTQPEFNPKVLGRVKDLSKKAELIPDDLLPL